MNDSSISVDELSPWTSYRIASSLSCSFNFFFEFKVSFAAFNDIPPNVTSLFVIAVAFLGEKKLINIHSST